MGKGDPTPLNRPSWIHWWHRFLLKTPVSISSIQTVLKALTMAIGILDVKACMRWFVPDLIITLSSYKHTRTVNNAWLKKFEFMSLPNRWELAGTIQDNLASSKRWFWLLGTPRARLDGKLWLKLAGFWNSIFPTFLKIFARTRVWLELGFRVACLWCCWVFIERIWREKGVKKDWFLIVQYFPFK